MPRTLDDLGQARRDRYRRLEVDAQHGATLRELGEAALRSDAEPLQLREQPRIERLARPAQQDERSAKILRCVGERRYSRTFRIDHLLHRDQLELPRRDRADAGLVVRRSRAVADDADRLHFRGRLQTCEVQLEVVVASPDIDGLEAAIRQRAPVRAVHDRSIAVDEVAPVRAFPAEQVTGRSAARAAITREHRPAMHQLVRERVQQLVVRRVRRIQRVARRRCHVDVALQAARTAERRTEVDEGHTDARHLVLDAVVERLEITRFEFERRESDQEIVVVDVRLIKGLRYRLPCGRVAARVVTRDVDHEYVADPGRRDRCLSGQRALGERFRCNFLDVVGMRHARGEGVRSLEEDGSTREHDRPRRASDPARAELVRAHHACLPRG